MNDAIGRAITRNVVAGIAIAAVGLLSIWGFLTYLGHRKATADDLQKEINAKHTALTGRPADVAGASGMRSAEALLGSWRGVAEREAQRIGALSATAEEAGMTIVSLRSLDRKIIEEKNIIASSHEVEGVGNYRQIAQFLDGVYAADGLAAIEALVIEPDEDEDSELLQAYLQVTWYGPGASEGEIP